MFSAKFNSILDIVNTFDTEQKCIDYLEKNIWGGCPRSPFKKDAKIYTCKNGKYKCQSTGKYFNVKKGTIFESTKISLRKWFVAIWILTSHKKGISSLQLAKDIGVTQKTAWYMLQKIRSCFSIENGNKLEGTVEADETFIGGKNKNRHKDKKVKNSQGRSFKDKVPVLGLLQRNESEIVERPHKIIKGRMVKEKVILKESKITAYVVGDTKRRTIQPYIFGYVASSSRFLSDEWSAYDGLGSKYNHSIVDHSKKEYVNSEDNTIHTNTIEGSWNILKKSVSGMYNHVSKKHLQKYVDEFVFRYNTKNAREDYRFNLLLYNSDRRVTYKDLVANSLTFFK